MKEMDIQNIDKNFNLTFEVPDDVEWFSVRENPFHTYGVFYSEEEGLYRRLPKDIADATNEGVAWLSKHSAGGRVRFETDSPYIVLHAKECFETMIVNDGESALSAVDSFAPNLILLDLMLPGIDGYQVCREVRAKSSTPIIMLSAKGEIFDKVLGLELGADDYMEKPFDSKELVARVKAVLRRYKSVTSNTVTSAEKKVEYPDLVINQTNYSVYYKGQTVEMPPKELELLYFLASSPNHVFTREQLLDQIWGYEYIGDTRTVDVHIKRLREKINDHDAWRIATIWGIGYKFEVK